jgi:hypothetical protein
MTLYSEIWLSLNKSHLSVSSSNIWVGPHSLDSTYFTTNIIESFMILCSLGRYKESGLGHLRAMRIFIRVIFGAGIFVCSYTYENEGPGRDRFFPTQCHTILAYNTQSLLSPLFTHTGRYTHAPLSPLTHMTQRSPAISHPHDTYKHEYIPPSPCSPMTSSYTHHTHSCIAHSSSERFFFFPVFSFFGAMDQTQGLAHAKQALYH